MSSDPDSVTAVNLSQYTVTQSLNLASGSLIWLQILEYYNLGKLFKKILKVSVKWSGMTLVYN